jgi:glycosyltransferase involved in cell wall biosynthesis
MRIVYVTINVAVKIMTGGVGAKIKRQVSLWKDKGHIVKIFILTPETVSIPDSEQFVFKPLVNVLFLKFLAREISRSRNLIKMIAAIKAFQPDIIYLRFGLYTFPLHQMFKIAPVALEVNSNDIDEYRTRGAFFYWLNRLTRGIVFSLSSALVPVSQTLADINASYGKPACVVSNGIDLDAYQPLPAPKNDAPVLTAIGSPGMIWHGMDKLFPLARRFPDITINIIGYGPEDFSESAPPNLHLHGYLNHTEIREILANTDVAFSTLAQHRKNMQENPSLKVREALAFGIPVIMAEYDADLADLKSNCFLFLPNTEDNVALHAESIREFAYNSMGIRVRRALIAGRIDQRLKEEKRLAFFAEIANLYALRN